MNRAVRVAACSSLVLLATAGCSTTTAGVPVEAMMADVSSAAKTTAASPPDGLPPGRLGALLLSDDTISNIVGLPMQPTGSWKRPGAVVTLRDRNDCKVLTVSDQDLWTSDFTAYRQVAHQDSDEVNFFAWQGAATYEDTRTASRVFQRSINPGLQARCKTATLPAENDEQTTWRVDSLTVTGSALSVTLSEIRHQQMTGWRCSTRIRVQRNVMQRAGACQFGNPVATAQQMADLISDRIGG
ncbi:sensor domain-containing protein [Mycolicibacter terrae]|nr:sensor domain-containing protein [Mycolicibacter terrae]